MKRISIVFSIFFIGTLIVTNLLGQESDLVDIGMAEQAVTVGGPGLIFQDILQVPFRSHWMPSKPGEEVPPDSVRFQMVVPWSKR